MRRRSLPSEFRPVCQYVMRDGKPQDVKILDESLWHQAGVVYARAHEGEVVFIGCTDGTLRGRITRHLNYISTSALGRAARYREWAEGKLITILAYRPPPVSILGFQVEVHRALEAHMIKAFKREKNWLVARC
jgi:hypothetical protein